ncbi:MAG: anthranilate synthase component 1, partial [Alphaproteobacteria bacterium]|nr:anthranilate synthase component 1 [Alphaproteobacteria bacterium]
MLNGEALVRDLPGRTDPLALYLHLTGGGADTMLFERPSGPTLVLAAAAVRIECRGRNVTVSALGEEGGSVIDALAETLPHRLVERSETGAGFAFPSVVSVDPSERLASSSAFD